MDTSVLPDGFASEFDLSGLLSRWPEAAMQVSDPRIGIARTPEELHAIARLRYDLYIARDGKRYDRARHISRTFVEPIDRVSLNIFLRRNTGVMGAVRLVRADDALNDPHLRPLVETARPTDITSAIVNCRFMLTRDMYARSLIEPLFRQAYRSGFLAGGGEYFLASRPEVSPLFLKFGFQPTGKSFVDPIAGEMTILSFDSADLSHRRFAERYLSQLEDQERSSANNLVTV